MDLIDVKRSVGYQAAELVSHDMTVGLGTGSTVYFFLERLAQRVKSGLCIRTVASSNETQEYALKHEIPLVNINQLTHLDLTVDGADEIDDHMNLIKGGGGALLREKILAFMSHRFIIIADQTKLCENFGKTLLPIEITPFAAEVTQRAVNKIVLSTKLRKNALGTPFITDNGNFILDAKLPYPLDNPETLDSALKNIPGVVETGFFFNLASSLIIGFTDGNIIFRSKT